MTDFDKLLEETLQDVREAEPSIGMNARIIARVGAKARPGPRWSLLTGAVAAALLIAVLLHAGTRVQTKSPAASRVVAPMVVPGGDNASGRFFRSAEGATDTSLGRRLRYAPNQIRRGPKARDIEAASATVRRGKYSLSRHPRDASLHIPPIVIVPLHTEPIELASLTLKNPNARGEPR